MESEKAKQQGMDIDKGCSLCCRLEAVNTFEALWGFSLEPRQQFVLSSRYIQINYIKCKHFILWSGPECVHEWSLQRHNSCKPQPCIKKKNPEEIVLPCLDNINFMWFFYIEKRKRFLVQFTGHWTPDRTEPNWLGERNKDIFLPFSGFCCSGFCRCHVLRAALLFSPNLR